MTTITQCICLQSSLYVQVFYIYNKIRLSWYNLACPFHLIYSDPLKIYGRVA